MLAHEDIGLNEFCQVVSTSCTLRKLLSRYMFFGARAVCEINYKFFPLAESADGKHLLLVSETGIDFSRRFS